jgi:hypothetical protein
LHAITAYQGSTRTDAQVAAVIRICTPCRETAAFKAILEEQVGNGRSRRTRWRIC